MPRHNTTERNDESRFLSKSQRPVTGWGGIFQRTDADSPYAVSVKCLVNSTKRIARNAPQHGRDVANVSLPPGCLDASGRKSNAHRSSQLRFDHTHMRLSHMNPSFFSLAAGVGLLAVVPAVHGRGDDQSCPASPQSSDTRDEAYGWERGRGQWADPRFIEDQKVFQLLLDNRRKITRTVTRLPNGVQTITESDIPDVASGIQTHVASMHTRAREQRGIHLRDPLFREVFQHADRISMEITNTDKGVHVTETSDDPHVVALVQAHADVVSRFIEHGHDEVRRNHAVPSQAQ